MLKQTLFLTAIAALSACASATQTNPNTEQTSTSHHKLLIGHWRCETHDTFGDNRYFSHLTILPNGLMHNDTIIFVAENDITYNRYQLTDGIAAWRLEGNKLFWKQQQTPKMKNLASSTEQKLMEQAETKLIRQHRLDLEQAWKTLIEEELTVEIRVLDEHKLEKSLTVDGEVISNVSCERIKLPQ